MTSVNRIQLNELRGDSAVGIGTPAEKRDRCDHPLTQLVCNVSVLALVTKNCLSKPVQEGIFAIHMSGGVAGRRSYGKYGPIQLKCLPICAAIL